MKLVSRLYWTNTNSFTCFHFSLSRSSCGELFHMKLVSYLYLTNTVLFVFTFRWVEVHVVSYSIWGRLCLICIDLIKLIYLIALPHWRWLFRLRLVLHSFVFLCPVPMNSDVLPEMFSLCFEAFHSFFLCMNNTSIIRYLLTMETCT